MIEKILLNSIVLFKNYVLILGVHWKRDKPKESVMDLVEMRSNP